MNGQGIMANAAGQQNQELVIMMLNALNMAEVEAQGAQGEVRNGVVNLLKTMLSHQDELYKKVTELTSTVTKLEGKLKEAETLNRTIQEASDKRFNEQKTTNQMLTQKLNAAEKTIEKLATKEELEVVRYKTFNHVHKYQTPHGYPVTTSPI